MAEKKNFVSTTTLQCQAQSFRQPSQLEILFGALLHTGASLEFSQVA